MQRKIIFVNNSSPMLGRAPPVTSAIFSWFREKSYIQTLQEYLKREAYCWEVEPDASDANIDEIKQYANIIVCAPGLQWQFFIDDFDKNRIIYLSTMEYATNNIERVCKLINLIERRW